MFELKGKYNECKVFADIIENSAIAQLTNMMNFEHMNGKIRIMPDCHAGSGCVIGTTMTIKDKVTPYLVGVDIGCGVLAVKLKETRMDLSALDSVIRKNIPSGGEVYAEAVADFDLDRLICKKGDDKVLKSIGTLGGGNHFIEVDKDENGNLWLVIHSGSRSLGLKVCEYYQKLGHEGILDEVNGGSLRDKNKAAIEMLTKAGRKKEISKTLEKIKEEHRNNAASIPYELAYVKGNNFNDYIHDMKVTQEYAALNRRVMANRIIKAMKLHELDSFDTIHNYIDTDNMVLRKGAVAAYMGQKLLIPMNMRDGSLVCVGKGNDDWNCSAPHGAGRLMSRRSAKESISMDEYRKSMEGIFTTCVSRGTIDESPMSYKPMESIVSCIGETVDVVDVIKPIYNFKAGEE